MKVIVFNGPPYAGKDTLAALFTQHIEERHATPIKHESLSLPLRHIAYAMVGRKYTNSSYDAFKKEWFPALQATGRQLMIDASERFLKQVYGQEVLVKMLEERSRKFEGLMLVRDGGFQIEVDPIIRWVGAENAFVVRVSRPACTFEGDSRESVFHPYERMNMEVVNDSDISSLRLQAALVYDRLLNRGWKF